MIFLHVNHFIHVCVRAMAHHLPFHLTTSIPYNHCLYHTCLPILDNIPPSTSPRQTPARDFAMSSGAPRSVPGSPAVRFASSSQEIEPVQLDETNTISGTDETDVPRGQGQQLRDLSDTLSGTHLQSRRMSHFNFEPVSLPASRVRELYAYPSPCHGI